MKTGYSAFRRRAAPVPSERKAICRYTCRGCSGSPQAGCSQCLRRLCLWAAVRAGPPGADLCEGAARGEYSGYRQAAAFQGAGLYEGLSARIRGIPARTDVSGVHGFPAVPAAAAAQGTADCARRLRTSAAYAAAVRRRHRGLGRVVRGFCADSRACVTGCMVFLIL